MTINLDAAGGAASGARLDRRSAMARQDRWMLELERAAMTTQPGKDEKPRTAPLERALTADPRMADANPAQAPEAGEPDATTRLPHTRRAHRGHAGQAGTPAHAADGGAVTPTAAAAPSAQPGALLSNAPDVTIGDARFAPAPHARAGTAEPEVQVTFAFERSDALLAGENAHTGAAGQAMPEMPDGATFDQRLLHLFVGDDGVHAYLRDAQLQGNQARAVAQAMAAQLAASGQSLAGLSINGKPVITRAAPQAERDALHQSGGEHGLPTAPMFTPSVKKGNS